MPLSQPTKLTTPFANSGTKNTIPVPSQIGITPGAASYTDGFPPLTMTPIASGGIPPFGQDFNGIFFAITEAVRWQEAGGAFPYDSTFATDVGGYPLGALVQRSDGLGQWLNTSANNTTDPEAGGAGWVPAEQYGITAVTMTSSNVTLTSLQAGKRIILITGAMVANLNLIFPLYAQEWLVINSTTGSFTITAKTAAGTGVVIAQGGGTRIYGDGTNIEYSAGIVPQAEAEARAATTLRGWTAQRVGQAIAAGIAALVVQATETVAGKAELATQAETNAGTDDARIVTPLKLRTGFAVSLASNGYIALPTWLSGLIIQWGSSVTDVSGVVTVTFPLAWPTAMRGVGALPLAAASGAWMTHANLTTTNVQFKSWRAFNTIETVVTFSWMAVGY